MEKKIKYSVNNLPKYMNFLFILFPLLGMLLIARDLDNDFYFLYKLGEYITNNGFPVNDVLSMHSDMKLVVQQWLCDVLYYKIYSVFGLAGMITFVSIIYLLFVTVFYKLCKLVSNNFFVSIVLTSVAGLFVSVAFFTTRPQIVTYIVFLLLFYALESYIKTKKVVWLSVLPLLSVFLINWHASMWWLLFVFMLPYLVESVPVHIKKFKQEPCCNIFALLISMVVMFAFGFINPYGKDAVFYLFGSYGISELNSLIQEMQPIAFNDSTGKLLFVIAIALILLLAIYKKGKIKTRFLCLTLGTLVLALSSVKGLAYFYICVFFSLAYFLKDFDYSFTVTESKRTKKEKVKLVALVLIFVVMIGALIFVLSGNEKELSDDDKHFNNLITVVDILDNEEKDVALYAGFNEGQYLEYRGYKPYIDGRAEVFLEKNNESFDYFKEYYKVKNGTIYYKDFVDKYNFTHLIVSSSGDSLLEPLKHDDNYEILCENEDYYLFALKG